MSKSVTSLQIKVHECYVKPLKPRESLLKFEEDEESEYEISSDEESDLKNLEEALVESTAP